MNATQITTQTPIERDVLHGHEAIADFLGITVRQAKYWHEHGRIPTFKPPESRTVCARRSTLNAWLSEQEAKARNGVPA